MQNKTTLIVIGIIVLAIGCGTWYFVSHRGIPSGGAVSCTQEAMQCPDGSFVGRTGPNCEFVCPSTSSTTSIPTLTVDVSNWKTYTSNQYGLSLKYPADWIVSENGMSNDLKSTSSSPFFELHPASDQAYLIIVSILNNPGKLSSADFVADFIAKAKTADMQAEANQEAPDNAPRFDKEYATTVGSYPAYELYNVFEYDRGGEQIFVARNSEALKFDFAVAGANANIIAPAENNIVAHQIINTLVFTK